MNPFNFVTNHPYQTIAYALLFSNLVATMPSPNGTGFRGSTGYKWAFAFLHMLPNIPRLLSTIFPQFAGEIGLLNSSETAAAVSSHAINVASTEAVKTVEQASKAAEAVAEVKNTIPDSK